MILYLGLDAPPNCFHYPVIKIMPKELSQQDLANLTSSTHVIFTSKTAVQILKKQAQNLKDKTILAVGKKTAGLLQDFGFNPLVASNECAEGIIDLLKEIPLTNPQFFWPHSNLSRDLISSFIKEKGYRFFEAIIYNTVPQTPLPIPNLNQFEEIIFTSPSTIDGFLAIFGTLPPNKKLTAIGPITEKKLQEELMV